MKCASVKFVPELLRVNKKATRLAVARDLLQCADQGANFTKTIITSDDSWVYGYDQKQKPRHYDGSLQGLHGQKGTPSSEQGNSNVDSFLQSQRHCSSRACTRWSNSYQEYYVKVLYWLYDAMQHKLPVLCEVTGSCTMTMPLPTCTTLSRLLA